jgi:hypothetical protein
MKNMVTEEYKIWKCVQCGGDTKTHSTTACAVLVDGILHRVHMGLCYAKLCLENQDVLENSGIDIEDIKNYINETECDIVIK